MINAVQPQGSAFRAGLQACRRPGAIALAGVVAAALVLGGTTSAMAEIVPGQVSVTDGNIAGGTQTNVAVNGMSFTQVFAGNRSGTAFGLIDDGTLYGWGYNPQGQIGNRTTTDSAHPTPVTVSGALAGKTVTQVAVGGASTLALASDGTLYSWGSNAQGQLGVGTSTSSNTPVAVTMTGALAGKKVAHISGGQDWFVALTTDGGLYSWGNNADGQLGNGLSQSSNVPVAVDMTAIGSKTITSVSAGRLHTLALASDGTVYGWGGNSAGALGNGTTTSSPRPTPVTPAGTPMAGKVITSISAGTYFSFALASDGTTYGWGLNNSSQLGNGTAANSLTPVAITTSGALNGKSVVKLAATSGGASAVTADGGIYSWGINGAGQLGNGSNVASSNVPVPTTTSGKLAGKVVSDLSGGNGTMYALATDGSLFAWGDDTYGQAGDSVSGQGTATYETVPSNTVLPSVRVTFGGTAATGVTRVDSKHVRVTAPARAAGLVDVVATAGGTSGTTPVTSNFKSVTTTASQAFRYVVAPSITTTTLATPVVGQNYSDRIVAGGATAGTITYAVSSGSLPVGLSLSSSTGVISGVPTSPDEANFTITATNASGSDAKSYKFAAAELPTILTTSLGDAGLNSYFNATVSADGTKPMTFAIASGALPDGLSLDANTGIISGTATVSGSYTFAVSATNVGGARTKTYTINIADAPVISTSALEDAVVGSSYAQSIEAAGSGSVTYAVTEGALPAGLSLNARTGIISGTATTTDSATFTVTATNAVGSDSVQLTVVARTKPVFDSTAINDGIVGQAFSAQLAASGSGTLSYAVSAGKLPTGLSLDSASGVISGTPTAGGEFMFAVKVSSQYGSDTSVFTSSVHTAPTITSSSIADGTVRSSYSAQVSATGEGTLSYTMSAGSLPAGLKLNTETGAITGIPSASGTSTFTITVVNAFGSASQTFKSSIAAAKMNVSIPSANYASGAVVPVTVSGLDDDEVVTVDIAGAGSGTATANSAGVATASIKLAAKLATKKYAVTVTGANHGTATAAATVSVVAPKMTASVPAKTVKPGAKVKVTVKGLLPGEVAKIVLGSTNYGTAKANSAGVAAKTITLNKKLTTKKYTITVTGSLHGTAKATVTVSVKK